ncbi:MAG: N-acetyltransferase family protein [Bacillota bacterium]
MIRKLEVGDVGAILDIYSYYIKNTSYSFEIDVPSFEDFQSRIFGIAENFPFLVYTRGGEIVGYAYASDHNKRQAYRFGVDVSIYISHNHLGGGIGTKLYEKLFEVLTDCGIYNAFSCITIPNEISVSIHEKFGFHEVGRFANAGYKFGKWHDILWMQKQLKSPDENPSEVIKMYENI